MLNVYKLHYVSGSTDDLYVYFLVCNIPSIAVNHIKRLTLGTKVLQGQGSYYDGSFWYIYLFYLLIFLNR